jgi:two-component system OmpR family sensor kinase
VGSRQSGRVCEIIVDDDGEGVPPQERELIFQRFYRRANDGSGTGLGLAIVRWIAQAHEGVVTVAQAPGGGARFVAALPAHTE